MTTIQELAIASLATPEPETPPPEPETPETAPAAEGEPAPEPEAATDPEPASDPEADPAEGEGDPEVEAAPPEPVPDDALVTDEDGTAITVAELKEREKSNGLRQAAFTRKTQEVADLKREVQRKALEVEATEEEFKVWIQGMGDPDTLEAQCLEYWPKAYEAAVERRARELIALRDADPREKDLTERERDHRVRTATERSRAARTEAVSALEQKRHEAETNQQRVAETSARFADWNAKAMASAGLDTKNQAHMKLVVGLLKASNEPNLTEQHFRDAAEEVARVAGAKKAPEPPKAKPKTVVERKAAPVPPSTGGKASAARPTGAQGNGHRPKAKRSMTDFINETLTGK